VQEDAAFSHAAVAAAVQSARASDVIFLKPERATPMHS